MQKKDYIVTASMILAYHTQAEREVYSIHLSRCMCGDERRRFFCYYYSVTAAAVTTYCSCTLKKTQIKIKLLSHTSISQPRFYSAVRSTKLLPTYWSNSVYEVRVSMHSTTTSRSSCCVFHEPFESSGEICNVIAPTTPPPSCCEPCTPLLVTPPYI